MRCVAGAQATIASVRYSYALFMQGWLCVVASNINSDA